MGKEQELLEAARNGNVAVVDKILSSKSKKTGPLASLRRGPNPNCQDVNGYTPLHHAALNGHKEAVSLLLYHDASVNVVDNKGSSPLHLAAWNGNVEIVRMLLSQGPLYPNINLENHDNETALHCAAQYGHTEVVLILLKKQCNSAIRNNRDETALDLAAQYGRLETVELLIKTHPELINCVGKKHSALHLASRNGHRQVVQVLLEAGFDINTQTENGSALHEAALFGKVDVARLLLDCEIDIKIKDLNGKTVLDLLKDHKSQKAQEITEIIEGETKRKLKKRIAEHSSCHTPLIDLNSSTSSNWHADPPSSTGPYQNILLPNHIKQSTPKTDIHRPGVPPPPPPPPLHSDSSSSSEIYQTPPRPKVVVADNKYEVSTPGNNSISSDTSGIYETPPHPKSIESSVDKGQTDIWLTANSPIVGGSYLHMGPFSPTKPGSKPQKPPRKSLAPTSPPIREESKAYEYIYLASTGISSNKVDYRSSQSYEFMQLSSEVKLTPHKGRQYENVGKDELNTFPKRERRASESRELTRRSSFGQCESRESHRRSSISHMETSWRNNITHSEGGRRGSMSYGESAEKLRRSSISYGESPERIRNGSGSCIIIKSQDNNNMLSSKFGSEKLFSSNCERLEKPTKLDLTSKRSSAPEIPLSPTGYDQPPTPDHPPPSPHTAESGIHEKIRPLSQPRHKWSYHNFGTSWDESYFSEPDYLNEVRPFNANLKSLEFLSLDEVTFTECEYKYKRRSRDMETITDEEFLRSIEPVYKEHKSVSTENMEDVNDNTPFAGLKRGSISSDKERWRSRHSWGKSSSLTYMNVPPPPPPTTTSPKQELENGSQSRNDTSDYQKRDSLVVMSPLDENAEWAKIEDIMASFGGGVARESVFARELEEEFNRRLWADKYCFDKLEGNSVGDWLRKYELQQYENMLVANGFDNTDFLGGNILEEEELIEMGVTNAEHRQRILAAAITLPSIQPVGDGHNSLSVEQWLESLHLSEYVRVFMDNGFTDMSRVRKIWEVELTTVLEINSLGHRKRILASLGDRPAESLSNSSHAHHNNLEFNLPNIQSQLSSGLSEDSSVFKDYSGITPHHIPSEQEKSFQNQSLAFSLDRSKWSAMRCSISPEISVRQPGLIGNPTIPIRHWRHKPDVLVKGCCNYTAQYLGSTLVTEPKGLNSTKESITKIKISNRDMAKIPSIQLSISYNGVKFIDAKSKLVICEHEIRNIHCACQDGDDLNYFAYITKDHLTEKHYCHVFKVKSMELATDIVLTLGQAFEVAYQMALKETAALSARYFEQSLTSSEESGNGAPKEKNKVRVHSRKSSSS